MVRRVERGVGNFGCKVQVSLDRNLGWVVLVCLRDGGGVGGVPLLVGEVLSARDKGLKAMEMLKGVLGEEIAASVEKVVQEHPPPKAPTPSRPSPTKEERMERHAALLTRRKAVEKRLEEGRSGWKRSRRGWLKRKRSWRAWKLRLRR